MSGGAPFELKIGRRYLRSSGNRFLSFISLMSMVGVAIGVAVLIVVLSVAGIGFGLAAFLLRRVGPTIIAHGILNAVAVTVALVRAD